LVIALTVLVIVYRSALLGIVPRWVQLPPICE
jgi:hypothetical protein